MFLQVVKVLFTDVSIVVALIIPYQRTSVFACGYVASLDGYWCGPSTGLLSPFVLRPA